MESGRIVVQSECSKPVRALYSPKTVKAEPLKLAFSCLVQRSTAKDAGCVNHGLCTNIPAFHHSIIPYSSQIRNPKNIYFISGL
jgi:hypothetical protein